MAVETETREQDSPTLAFDEDHVVITDANNKLRGTYLVAPEKTPPPIDLVLRAGVRTAVKGLALRRSW